MPAITLVKPDGTDAESALQGENGAAFVDIRKTVSAPVESVIHPHIPPTAIANPVTAAIPVHRLGYYNGVIAMTIPATVTGANLLTQIAFSMDGVTFTEYFTLADTAGGVAQTVIVDLAQLADGSDAAGFAKLVHLFPYFSIRLSGGGGTGNVSCDVAMEK